MTHPKDKKTQQKKYTEEAKSHDDWQSHHDNQKRKTKCFTLSYKWEKAIREGGLLGEDFFGLLRTSIPRLSPLENMVEYLEEQLVSRSVPKKSKHFDTVVPIA